MDSRLGGLKLKTSLLALADLALPRVCLICGKPLMLSEKHLCMSCLASLPETHFAALSHNPMADKFNAAMSLDDYEPYAYAAALYYYSSGSPYKLINLSLKYGRNLSSGRYFASLLASQLAASEIYADADLVVPVPLHWSRQLRRGYNQAEVIARELSKGLGIACEPHLLKRNRRTRTQTRLSVEQKAVNVSGAFEINRRRAQKNKEVKHIIVVDDVFTTGATIRACHTALRAFYPPQVRISAVTLGFVGAI